MVLGVLLGAAIETFVPEQLFTQYLGGANLVGLIAALVVAGIFSADSLGSLPWVQSLLTNGLAAGSAMILLVAGVGTNVSTLGPVGQMMGRRTAVWYASSVVLLAGIFGVHPQPCLVTSITACGDGQRTMECRDKRFEIQLFAQVLG